MAGDHKVARQSVFSVRTVRLEAHCDCYSHENMQKSAKIDEMLAGFVELGYATLSYGDKNLRTRRLFRHQTGRNLFRSPCGMTS